MAASVLSKFLRKTNGFGNFSRSKNGQVQRKFTSSSSVGAGPDSVPLSQPLPNITVPHFMKATSQMHRTEVTTLDNGLRVASENKFGHICTAGVLIESGSRFEVNLPSGVTHFLEKLAFSSTPKYKDREDIENRLAKYGGIVDCRTSRDMIVYGLSLEASGLRESMDILSDVILRPLITEEELEGTRQSAQFQIEKLDMDPNPDVLLQEWIHKAAFRENTLGLPRYCPQENIAKINKSHLYTYLKNFHTPERMVVAAVGVPHKELVDLAQEYFVEKRPIWEEIYSELVDPKFQPDLSLSQYTGGSVLVTKDLSNVSLGPNPMPELAHFVIGLEGSSHENEEDFFPFCVLNMLMGGGGSFSAGGPGKGLYSRLYTHVINRHPFVHSAIAYCHAYSDGGIFSIHSSANPKQLGALVDAILQELNNVCTGLREDDVARAKTQLQSMMMMSLETTPVMFEDVGSQVLNYGERKPPQYFFDKIGAVTTDDLYRILHKMLKSKPAVVGLGTLDCMPSYDKIQQDLLKFNEKGHKKSLFNIF